MINVVCFYWKGSDRPGWLNVPLARVYISKLQAGVARNLSLEHRFICFSNEGLKIDNVETRMFASPSYRGCLPKLSVFNPDNGLEGRVIMLDLDIAITGNLDEMFSYTGEFMTREAFRFPGKSGGDIVFFEAGNQKGLWAVFRKNTKHFENKLKARERLVYREYKPDGDFVQQKYPGQIFSYRRHIMKKGLPESCRIVTFHGKPRPHEVKDKWVMENWI